MTATTSGEFPSHDMAARRYCNERQVDVVADLADLPSTGDMWTTAVDLNRYTAALQHGQLLTAGSMAVMFTSHAQVTVADPIDADFVQSGYGYGSFLGPVRRLTPASTPETTPATRPCTLGYPIPTSAWPCSATAKAQTSPAC